MRFSLTSLRYLSVDLCCVFPFLSTKVSDIFSVAPTCLITDSKTDLKYTTEPAPNPSLDALFDFSRNSVKSPYLLSISATFSENFSVLFRIRISGEARVISFLLSTKNHTRTVVPQLHDKIPSMLIKVLLSKMQLILPTEQKVRISSQFLQ